MRGSEKLTALKVSKLKDAGRYGDGRGLWLHIGKNGSRSWVLRYMRAGKAREMGLGPIDLIGLAEAREKARDARKLILEGLDPIEARKAHRTRAALEAAKGITFGDAAEKFIAAQETDWKNPKHRSQWRATIATYCNPIIGKLSVASIDTGLVLKVLEPVWAAKPETASRVQQRMKRILDWAKVRGYRTGDNPAAWTGHLDQLLPAQRKAKRVKHHPALSYAEIPAFMDELRNRKGVSAKALELTILMATRTSETIGAKWPEFDFAAKVWTVPAERMKAGREHRIPLSDRSIELLAGLNREGDFVFPGNKVDQPLSNMAMLELLKEMRPGLTVHGFRSTFRDWAAESTNYPNHVVEMALAHTIGDKVEAAYRRGELFEKRKRLMRDWARYCGSDTKICASGNVVLLKVSA